jgi:hypothetical protein
MDPNCAPDCATIIKHFERHMLSAPSEASIVGALTPQLASIQVNAASAASNLRNLTEPPVPKQVASAFASNASSGDSAIAAAPDFSDMSKIADINNWQEWLKSCIPCDLRVEFRTELIGKLDDTLLEALEEMLNQYLKQIAFILNLLNATDVYGDVCPLLFAMQDICIPDLQRILSLLASILYRMTVKELSSVDLMKLLLIPLFQPLFLGLLGLLNQYKTLITDPLVCVSSSINTQLGKLKTGSVLNETLANDLANKTRALGSGEFAAEDMRAKANAARQPFNDLDEGISAIQDASGMAVSHLHRMMQVGIFEIQTLLDELTREINSFVGLNNRETVEFLLNQYQKMIIFRLISFISALVKALTVGFNCDFNNPAKAEDTVSTFLNDFLGPNTPIIVGSNTQGKIQLIINPDLVNPLKDVIATNNVVIQATGNVEVDAAFSAIITQSSQPVTVKPACVFEPSGTSGNKLAEWIKELEATG